MILIAENLTATCSDVARAVREHDREPIVRLAEQATEAGVAYLDVNLGPGKWGGPEAAAFVLEALAGAWSGGILVDSTNPEVMEAACRLWGGPVVLNGFSGDAGRERVLEIASHHEVDLVVLLMDQGIPKGADARLALAAELVGRCQEEGIGLDRLWVDPMVAPLGWADGQEYDAALLEVLRRLPEVLGEPVRTLIGLSNLTTGATRGNRVPWLQAVFMATAAGAGLTHVMVDIQNAELLRVGRALDVFHGKRLFAPQEFL